MNIVENESVSILRADLDNHNARHLYRTFGFEGGDDNADTPVYQFWTKPMD